MNANSNYKDQMKAGSIKAYSKKVHIDGNLIASDITHCDTFFRMGTGLIFRTKKSVEDRAWLFVFKKPRRVAVTMFFVFFPIDVIFLDANDNILEMKENFRPFSNYTTTKYCMSFLELKSGTIKKYNIKRSMKVKFS